MSRMQDKVAIITGGASGIGRGVVELFLAEGAKVVIADINADAGEAAAAELGDNAYFRQTDVTSPDSVKAMVDFAISELGRLDVVHNNAGAFGARGSIFDIEEDGFDFTFALLTKSVFLGMKYAAEVMKAQGGGSIINTASISATTPGYGPHIYQGAKAAVLQLSKTFALELAQYNITVNCVSPGGVYTPLIGNAFGLDEATTKEVADGVAATLPLGRTGTPMDIAHAVLFLAGDEASFITGQNLIVDGAEALGKPYAEQGIH